MLHFLQPQIYLEMKKMEGKHFVCIDLKVYLYHGKQHVAETPGQMWHKLAAETTSVGPSNQDCAKAHERCAVLCWQSIIHRAGSWSPVLCTNILHRHTQKASTALNIYC